MIRMDEYFFCVEINDIIGNNYPLEQNIIKERNNNGNR